jgi:energy-coupling factor transport system ATP-binding protein
MINRSEIIIEAKDLFYSYPGEEDNLPPALSGINLAVCRGEYVVLLGPNGSGKTTLLKLINALLAPSDGEVLVEGISTAVEENIPRIRRSCGMIFQNPDNQLVATTVEEDIAFGLENMALPSVVIQQRVADVSRLLKLDNLLQQKPHLLSGGEKQRTAIAGVLVMQPKCLLMDEPTAMLDPAGRRDVIDTVRGLNRGQGIAVVHVTHFPEEAASADRVIILSEGCLIREGRPEKILTDLSLLHELGLEGTASSELANLLREDGFPLPPEILFNRELVNSICSLERKS